MRLDETARKQAGVFSRAQALRSGLSADQVRGRLRAGSWQVVAPRVYAAASSVVSPETLACAGLLSADGRAVLGFATAARRWRMPVPADRRIHLIVAPGVRLRLPETYAVHRVALASRDRLVLNGLPTTSAPRTVEDCARA